MRTWAPEKGGSAWVTVSPHSPLHLPGQRREPSALPLERWPRARAAQSPGFLGHNRPPPTLILPPTWVKPTWIIYSFNILQQWRLCCLLETKALNSSPSELSAGHLQQEGGREEERGPRAQPDPGGGAARRAPGPEAGLGASPLLTACLAWAPEQKW